MPSHTCCLSSSTLKIDLFSTAFLELQWLVRLSPVSRPCPPPGSGALPTSLHFAGGQASAGPHHGGGEPPCLPRHRRESVPALHQPQGALRAGSRPLGEVGSRRAAYRVEEGRGGLALTPAFPRLSPGSPQGWSPGPGRLPPLVPAGYSLLAAEDLQRSPGAGAAGCADGRGRGGVSVMGVGLGDTLGPPGWAEGVTELRVP